MTTSMNERIHFLIKISLTLYSRKGWCWLCVKGELETGTDCYILTPSSSDHSSTSFSSWLGLLSRGSMRAQSPLSAAGSQFGILYPTDSNWVEPPRAPGYIIASSVLPLIYTGSSLDWRLERGSKCYTFSRKSKVTDPFMSQNTVSLSFFTDRCTLNFFITGFHSMDCLFDTGL